MFESIRIIRSGRLITVEPFPDSLRRVLTFSVLRQDYEARSGNLRTSQEKKRMYSVDDENPQLLFVLAGYTFRVIQHLKSLGYTDEQIHYEDVRNLQLEEPRIDLLDPLRDWQKEALSRLFSSDMGIVWSATATGKTFLIQEFCKAFPGAKIIITSHDSQPLRNMYRYLRNFYGSDQVHGLGVIGSHKEGSRITVAHIRSLLKTPVDDAQILIYDECHGASAPERSKLLMDVPVANMYGFSATAIGRLDQREPIMEALFGPVIYKKPYSEARDEGLIAPVVVHIYEVLAPEITASSHYRRQIKGIVRNDARNLMIARVAEKYGDQTQIITAQNNLEHVFRIKKRLPEHVPVYGSGSMTKKRWGFLKQRQLIPEGYHSLYPGEEFVIARQFREGKIRKAIATSVWDEGIDLPDLEVVIRADGIPQKIQSTQIPGRVTRLSGEKKTGLVVDFIDNFGSNFKRRSEERFRIYRELGFRVERKVL